MVLVSVFEFHLGTQQLPRLLLMEICIFSNMHGEIMAKAKLSKQHSC